MTRDGHGGAVSCPNLSAHTPSPDGYVAWHVWAATKARTHRQVRCDGCDRYAIWVPKQQRTKEQP